MILLIVYTSFCESFAGNLFSGTGISDLVFLSAGMLALFYLMYLAIRQACRLLKFDREDSIAAAFCGSKKSLVHGTVLSKVLFAGSPLTGLLLLPLMIYHALAAYYRQHPCAKNGRRRKSGVDHRRRPLKAYRDSLAFQQNSVRFSRMTIRRSRLWVVKSFREFNHSLTIAPSTFFLPTQLNTCYPNLDATTRRQFVDNQYRLKSWKQTS